MQALSTHTQHCHHDCLAQRDVKRTWVLAVQTMQRWIAPAAGLGP
ncbi:MAG TPA: hypothetical protein VFZ61_32335 [Polyangiales bacterium]